MSNQHLLLSYAALTVSASLFLVPVKSLHSNRPCVMSTRSTHEPAPEVLAEDDPRLLAAKAYIREHRPNWGERSFALQAVAYDEGDNWRVTFRLPTPTLGGTPNVIMRKEDLSVVRSYHGQ